MDVIEAVKYLSNLLRYMHQSLPAVPPNKVQDMQAKLKTKNLLPLLFAV